MTRVGAGRSLGGGVEGAERGGGESGSVVMMTGGGLSRDMVERRAGRKEGRRRGGRLVCGGGRSGRWQTLLSGAAYIKYI